MKRSHPDPAKDSDGNMTRYLRRSDMKELNLTWDGENRLVAVETLNPVSGDKKIVNTFDGQSRRVRKQVYNWSGSWTLSSDTSYVFDNWNVAAEYNNLGSGVMTKSYTWGLDLSGSIQGAGGVGGLLAVKDEATGYRYAFSFDANGNVSEMVDGFGSIVAHYEYDAFGNVIVATGALAQINPYRFSTKPVDESGLSYYGYRYYSPELGKWISRDPIGERGGVNLMGFVNNSATTFIDAYGKQTIDPFSQGGFDSSTYIAAEINSLTLQIQAEMFCFRKCVGEQIWDKVKDKAKSETKKQVLKMFSSIRDIRELADILEIKEKISESIAAAIGVEFLGAYEVAKSAMKFKNCFTYCKQDPYKNGWGGSGTW